MIVLAVILVGPVLVLPLAALAVVASGRREDLSRADVIVVLGCKVYPDGTPSPMLAARLERGLAVWRAGLAPILIVSGDGQAREGVDEAAAMKAWLVARGVPEGAAVADGSGVNTHATAVFTAAWLRAHGARSAVGVSSYFHLPRIRYALRRVGVAQVFSAPAGKIRWRDRLWIAREVGAWAKYLLWR